MQLSKNDVVDSVKRQARSKASWADRRGLISQNWADSSEKGAEFGGAAKCGAGRGMGGFVLLGKWYWLFVIGRGGEVVGEERGGGRGRGR